MLNFVKIFKFLIEIFLILEVHVVLKKSGNFLKFLQMKKSKFYEIVFLPSVAGYFVDSKVMGGKEHGVSSLGRWVKGAY